MRDNRMRIALQRSCVPAALASVLVWAGCNYGTTMPPPFVVGEGPTAVGKDRTRVAVGFGGGTGGCCGWLNGGMGGHARVRHGVAAKHEVGVSAVALFLSSDAENKRYPEHLFLSAKLDYKWQFSRYSALLLGGGGGLTPYSPFLGGDVGVVVGRPGWKKVVPYGAVRLSGSVPLGTVDRIITSEESGTTGPIVPNLTLLGAVGLEINFKRWIAWIIEVGGGGIFPIGAPEDGGRPGGAWYAYTGLSFRIGRGER